MDKKISCSIEGCEREVKIRTFCNKHYSRLMTEKPNSFYKWERKRDEDEYRDAENILNKLHLTN